MLKCSINQLSEFTHQRWIANNDDFDFSDSQNFNQVFIAAKLIRKENLTAHERFVTLRGKILPLITDASKNQKSFDFLILNKKVFQQGDKSGGMHSSNS